MTGRRFRTSQIKPACGARSACQRLSEADVCDRVAVGAQEWRDRLWFAFERESRAGVCAFVWMADTCVSYDLNRLARSKSG